MLTGVDPYPARNWRWGAPPILARRHTNLLKALGTERGTPRGYMQYYTQEWNSHDFVSRLEVGQHSRWMPSPHRRE